MFKGYKGDEHEIADAHPAANCLPWNLDGKDFASLIESVRSGYDSKKPLLVQAGSGLLIDGRRRALACVIAGVEAETEIVEWDDEKVIEYVTGHELSRRNLSPEQYAAALVDLNDLKGVGSNQHKKKPKEGVSADTPSKKATKSRKEIADKSGASTATVARLAKLKQEAPELLDVVREKKLPVNTAVRAAEELTPTQIKKIASADKPKEEALKLLGPEKPKPPKDDSNPNRGGNNFDYGANAKSDEPKPQILSTPRGEIVMDPFGRIVPNGIGDYFGDETWPGIVSDIENLVACVESTHASILKASRRPYSWIPGPEIADKFNAIRNEMVKQIDSIREGLPYALCGHCNGKKCKACRQSGYVPKVETELEPELYRAKKSA